VEVGVFGVPALFDQIFGSRLTGADLDEDGLIAVLDFAEVNAQPALAFMYVMHDVTPFVWETIGTWHASWSEVGWSRARGR